MDFLLFEEDANQKPLEEDSKIIRPYKEVERDELPIIWYEPNIDLEENLKALTRESRYLHFSSEYQEAIQLAKLLETSFLFMSSQTFDEGKLFEDFRALKDTYGRRYFDFEEEAVRVSLFKDISDQRIKSLKVYSFFTRKDFSNEDPVNEEEEEVMVMCDIKKMAEQFREDHVIIWCDPNFNPESPIAKQFDIAEQNKFKDVESLLKKLENDVELPYHLIISGKAQIEKIIDKIDDFKDLLCLYVYENPPRIVSAEKREKVKIEKTEEELIPKVIEGIRTNSKLKNTFPAFATQFDDWDKSHINKVHYYLKGFVHFENRMQAKRDFVNLAKKIYQDRKLFQFEKDYNEYRKEKILKWYTADSPVFKLINNCLRISTSDSLLYCRFLLKDMERAIKEEYQQQSENYNGLVYRGAFITKEEFEKLERNVGKEIEMYGFLSTTKKLQTAQKFLSADTENKVLITIIIPPFPLPQIDEQGFADMRKFSEFPEEEILFNVRSRFQVLEVGSTYQGTKCRSLVLLYGAQLLRKYMTLANPKISPRFELPVQLKCNHCETKNNLFALETAEGGTRIICQECFLANNFVSKNQFLLPISESVEQNEEKLRNLELNGKMLAFGTGAKSVYEKSCQCNQCLKFGKDFHYKWINVESEELTFECLECFKKNKEGKFGYLLLLEDENQVFWSQKQEKWEEVSMDFEAREDQESKAQYSAHLFHKVEENQKCQEFCRISLRSLVRRRKKEQTKMNDYFFLGKSSTALGNHQKGLEYYLKALEITKFVYGESHPQTVTLDISLGLVYESFGDQQKALKLNLKTLDMAKSIHGEFHQDIATLQGNVASLYDNFGEYQKGLEYNLKALNTTKSIYGESHPQTASSYVNLASTYHRMGDHHKALEENLKALETIKSIYGETHSQTAILNYNLAVVYASLGEYQKALECDLKALNITKSIFGESHPQTATSYGSLALVYENLGDYQKALEYQLKALDLEKSIYGETHPEFARSYSNLALVYNSLGDYQKALEWNLKALDVAKSVYGEKHPSTAISYGNLASVYLRLGDHQKALDYNFKANDIAKSVYGEMHPNMATSYSNIAAAYEHFGEYRKALEYNLKSLNIGRSLFGECHPMVAHAYNNLALVYFRQGDYQTALEYNLKVLEIKKSVLGEKHPETASSYNNMALVYNQLGDYQKALEESLKALDIIQSAFGETHRETAMCFQSLGLVYTSLGDHERAADYQMRSLNILKSIFGESHRETAAAYNHVVIAYEKLGDHQKALEYKQKSSNFRNPTFEEPHSEIASPSP